MQLCRADCVSAHRERRHSPIRHPPRHRPGLGPPDLTTGRCGGVILEETADFLTLGNEVDWTVRRKRGGPGWRRPSLRHQWFFPRRLRSQNRGGSVPLPVPLLWSSVTAPPHRQAEPRSHRMAHLSLCTDFLPTARGPPRPQRRATSAFLKAQGPLSPGRGPTPAGGAVAPQGPAPGGPPLPPRVPCSPVSGGACSPTHGAAGEQPLVSGRSVLLGNLARAPPWERHSRSSCRSETQRQTPHAGQAAQYPGSFSVNSHTLLVSGNQAHGETAREGSSSAEFPDPLRTARHHREDRVSRGTGSSIGRDGPRTACRNWEASAQRGQAVDAAVGGPAVPPRLGAVRSGGRAWGEIW